MATSFEEIERQARALAAQHRARLAETLLEPDIVIQSRSDKTVRLFHRFYGETSVGDKYLCVVVKYPQEAMFLLSRHISPLQLNGEEFYGKSESLV